MVTIKYPKSDVIITTSLSVIFFFTSLWFFIGAIAPDVVPYIEAEHRNFMFLMSMVGFIGVGHYIYSIAREGWLRVVFEVDTERIIKRYPSGKMERCSWKSLESFDVKKRKLVFADGTSIRLKVFSNFGITPEDLALIVDFMSSDSKTSENLDA